ncbi:MAG TPA: hypothetical protein VJR92_08750 [Gemmatimonadaceae bacterium]|nr:hypothetical protein [Gemmatimonadaceae bacterium]
MIAAPIAFIATFALMPLWSWIERTTGFESVGHSGPASWCFVAVYSALVAGFIAVAYIRTTNRGIRG